MAAAGGRSMSDTRRDGRAGEGGVGRGHPVRRRPPAANGPSAPAPAASALGARLALPGGDRGQRGQRSAPRVCGRFRVRARRAAGPSRAEPRRV